MELRKEDRVRIKWEIRFFSDESLRSQQAEALLKQAKVNYIKTYQPVDDVNPPAVEYQGDYFEGINGVNFFIHVVMGVPV